MVDPTPSTRAYAFGDFRLSPARRTLTRRGQRIAIRDKPFDLLVHLVDRAGAVVARDELAQALWPDTIVDDNNLSQTILATRRALGDLHASPRFIATVPRRGYQFVAPVRVVEEDDADRREARPAIHSSLARAAAIVAAVLLAGASQWGIPDVVRRGAGDADPLARRAPAATTPVAAHAAYLQVVAAYRLHGTGASMPPGVRQDAVHRLDDALALDPVFAAARGWRAQLTLDSLMFDGFAASDWPRLSVELMTRAERDIAAALDHEPSEAIASVALARLQAFRGRLPDARATLEQAIVHRPRDPVLLHYLSLFAMMLDDDAGAVDAARRAIDLDPSGAGPYSPLGFALWHLGDRAGAADAHRRAMELAPLTSIGYLLLTLSDERLNRRGTLDILGVAERLLGDRTLTLRAHAALSYARAGSQADARRLVHEMERATSGQHVAPGLAAMMRLAVGEYRAARELLERALATRESGMDPMPLFLIRRNSWRDPVLDDPSWRVLRERLARAG